MEAGVLEVALVAEDEVDREALAIEVANTANKTRRRSSFLPIRPASSSEKVLC